MYFERKMLTFLFYCIGFIFLTVFWLQLTSSCKSLMNCCRVRTRSHERMLTAGYSFCVLMSHRLSLCCTPDAHNLHTYIHRHVASLCVLRIYVKMGYRD
ncbi:hypothetical protein GDO78_007155 [Eleutherodactylus coqui]|uniref:Uncharacterized protein n=1 Tax=Eleutherodactylus coqui TaxID=57060 RepID=A0A8J6KFK3_ELECQ|nr:hypothetical protein GDO78_007155 [Eleutherodactylus coqui]